MIMVFLLSLFFYLVNDRESVYQLLTCTRVSGGKLRMKSKEQRKEELRKLMLNFDESIDNTPLGCHKVTPKGRHKVVFPFGFYIVQDTRYSDNYKNKQIMKKIRLAHNKKQERYKKRKAKQKKSTIKVDEDGLRYRHVFYMEYGEIIDRDRYEYLINKDD